MNVVEKKARLYHALGEPTRLRILLHLLGKKEPLCICHLSRHLGKDQSVVFRHIQLLREAGLVLTQKQGPFLYCRLKNNLKIRRLLGD